MNSIFAVLTLVALASPSTYAASLPQGCERAQALVQAVTSPAMPGVIYREFSIDARMVTDRSLAELENEFWQNSHYARMSGAFVNYAWVQNAARDGGIEAFRLHGPAVAREFARRYGADARLIAALPPAEALGTGYVDSLSDAFGDQFFAFACEGGAWLAVTVSHGHH